MIYLASPYTHPDPFVREQRYLSAMKVLTERFLAKKIWAYSPIVHCHELAKVFDLPKDAGFWMDYNKHMLLKSDKLVILRLEGWEKSDGLRLEKLWATEAKIFFEYI